MHREDKIGTAVIQTETWPTASPPIRYHDIIGINAVDREESW